MRRYRGVLFDLFGTLIEFDTRRLPALRLGEEDIRSTVGGLGELLAEWVPGTTPERFFEVLVSVSDEMARVRAYDHVELPSRERFRRALERVGCDDAKIAEAAVHLSRAHMAMIAAATRLPPAHAELLKGLRPGHRIGLVSNFDDTAAAYDILRQHDLPQFLDSVIVSEALGLRKPHPALFRAGLRDLGLAPADVLFVGDTFGQDVVGAQAAGLDVAWIDAAGTGVPDGAPAPTFAVRALPEIAAILDAAG
ncbi:MAG TPA: HAD family hydrolase [Candidatus Binatia bacterium]|nr:HAD family hydrolase [Candidatus Binatia bacterium]